MAKLKLPEQLKAWKVVSPADESGNYPIYSVVRTEFDGSKTNAVLTYVSFEGDNYNSENVDLVTDEANFVKSVSKIRGVSNYIDAVVDNIPSKTKISLYLLTTDAKPFGVAMAGKQFTDHDIVDFGLQISEILDKLEQNNILHGNIKPENVFVGKNDRYTLGGFTAFEGTADEPAFLAPEMQQGKQPDYTTDIYSLGLMMYAMANDGKLPFESDTADRAAAVKQRQTATTVPAPAHGSEKLKSVIVIACQPENRNRWKNANNLKNALAAIKAELPAAAAQAQQIIVPESTEFESNVFEEFSFEENENAAVPAPKQEADELNAPNMAKGAAIAANAAMQQAKDAASQEIDNKVFDDYEVHTRVFNLRDPKNAENKDYGDFFEEEVPEGDDKKGAPQATVPVKKQAPASDQEVMNAKAPFRREEIRDDQEPAGRSKSFIFGIIAIILAALVALAALAVFAVQNGLLPFGQEDTRPTAAPATEKATVEPPVTVPTAAPETTVPEETEPTEPTTEEIVDEDVTPFDVTGFYFDYAEEVLEGQGLKVEYGESRKSDDYDAGFIISMSPDSSQTVKRGSTITLIRSSGLTHPQESSSTESSNSDSGEGDYE